MHKKGYTLIGMLIAIFFATILLSSAVEVYIVLSNIFQELRKDRSLLNQLVITDQKLCNIFYKNPDYKLDSNTLKTLILNQSIDDEGISLFLRNDKNSQFKLQYPRLPDYLCDVKIKYSK